MEQVLGDFFFVLSYTGGDVAVNGAFVLDEVCAFYGFAIFWYNFFMRIKEFLVKLLYGSDTVVINSPPQLGDTKADNAELGGKTGQAPTSGLTVSEESPEQSSLRGTAAEGPAENSSLNSQSEGDKSKKFFLKSIFLRLIPVLTFLIWLGSAIYKMYVKFKGE